MVCIRSLCVLGIASLGASAAVEVKANPVKYDPAALTKYCTDYYTVGSGDTCWDIIARNANRFTMNQLMCWNADINPTCSNLIPGRQVCVAVSRLGPIC